jgi:hypothetical protein
MKRILSILGFFILFISFTQGQTGKVSGKVAESGTGAAVPHINVQIPSLKLSTATNAEGYFEFRKVPYGKYTISFSSEFYESYQTTVELKNESLLLPGVEIKKKATESEGISEISTLVLDQEDENKSQGVSGLLHSSEDVFVSTSGYVFGSMFFRPRGYDSENRGVLMSGTDVADPENGRSNFSEWGGLNDAMRNKESFNCIDPTPYSFSRIGGLTYINTRASGFRKQIKFSYSLSNRQYNNRAMLTYATGLMNNGWAFAVSGSRRWANEGYQEGTFYDGWSYFLAAEKKFSKKHSLALTVFGAPTKRGASAGTVQEAYDLSGSVYYNPNWGYQEGKKRNARVKANNEPEFILNHYWNINETTKLNTAVGYSFGTNEWTSLNWYNAPDPRPDYYRYLPSYYKADPGTAATLTKMWEENPAVRQINWDNMYMVNYLNNATGNQARYIVENNVNNTSHFTFNTVLDKEVKSNIDVTGGLNFSLYRGWHYKVMDDLLGGNYWVDIDQYNERDFPDENSKQNDLNNPNRIIYQGDKFGYNYAAHINNINLWGQGNFTYNKIDYYVSASLTGTQFWRTGYYRNGRHPDNSYGDSKKYNFFDYGLKAGLTYKITGRNFLTADGFYLTRAPYFTNSFISPKTRDNVVADLKSETIYGFDANYIIRYPWLNARLTYFYTFFRDANEITSFYHDDFKTYVNYVMSGINKSQLGLELGVEVKAMKNLSFTGVAAIGQYLYSNRPKTTISFDNGSLPDTSFTTYIKDYYVYGTPQTALSLGVKYSYKFWYLDVNANYYDNNWIDINPEKRTGVAIEGIPPGDPKINTIIGQEKLKGGFTLDASLGKSIRINGKIFLNINLSVSNILNNKDIQSGGYEQNRFDFGGTNYLGGYDGTQDPSAFPPKYYYYFGTTYFLNVSVRI